MPNVVFWFPTRFIESPDLSERRADRHIGAQHGFLYKKLFISFDDGGERGLVLARGMQPHDDAAFLRRRQPLAGAAPITLRIQDGKAAG